MSLFSSLSSMLPTAAGNALGAASAKIQEGISSIAERFGGKGPLDKLSAGTETIDEATAKHQFAVAEIERANAEDADAKFQAVADEALKNPYSTNQLTDDEMMAEVRRQNDADVSAATMKATLAAAAAAEQIDHLVSLTQVDDPTEMVIFTNMPDVTETRSIGYEPVAPPQSPGAFLKYKGTDPVQWAVNAVLTCRTTDEATINLQIINRLRGWSMPYFGENTKIEYPTKLGAPPPVLTFAGWRAQMVGPVPVVITSLSWSFPQDVDYIPARELEEIGHYGSGKLIPFPTVMRVAIQLTESFSTSQMNGFDLNSFKAGNFDVAWDALPSKGIDSPQVLAGNSLKTPEQAQKPFNPGRGKQGAPSAAELKAYADSGASVTKPTPTKPVATGTSGKPAVSEAKDFTTGNPMGDPGGNG